jgi:MFS family permease
MPVRQLILFSFVILIMTGNGVGIMTILPVYLKQLGAAPSFTGMFYSLIFVAMASSAYLGGWIADRFKAHKRTSILASVLTTLAFTGMLLANSLPVFAISMLLCWFFGSLHIFTVYTMVGLQAGGHERGRVFGILAFCGNFQCCPSVPSWRTRRSSLRKAHSPSATMTNIITTRMPISTGMGRWCGIEQ